MKRSYEWHSSLRDCPFIGFPEKRASNRKEREERKVKIKIFYGKANKH